MANRNWTRSVVTMLASACLSPSLPAIGEEPTPKSTYAEIVRDANAHFDAGRYAEAAAAYEAAIARNPHEWQRPYRLAISLYRASEFARAIPAYERAIELGGLGGTYRADLAYDIACCHARLGNKEEALASLRRALDLGFTNLDHVRRDADLDAIRADPRFREWLYVVDAATLSRDERHRFDLRCFASEIERLHWHPFRLISREEFTKSVRDLHDAIPSLGDPAIEVRLMQLARSIGDGHTRLFPEAILGAGAPVQLSIFEEGVFVTRAAPAVAGLVGMEVLRIGDSPVATAVDAVKSIVSSENDMFPLHMGAGYLRQPRLLNGLGVVPDPAKLPFTLRAADGTEKTVVLAGDSAGPSGDWATAAQGPEPLSAKSPSASFWFEHLEPRQAVYFQYNQVRNDPHETFEAFCGRLFDFIEANDVRKLVIDLRRNGGGDMTLNRPLVHGLIRSRKINRRGALFVIVGRQTFSAAMNAAADIERETAATFVGEPTGSSPNHVGESNNFTLPCSGMRGSIANQFFQRAQPFDSRTFIAPRLYVPLRFADFAANRDAALEAIWAEPPLDPR